MKPLAALNDFVVKFANVNGSGSASANELFARSILRHGVPVGPRNIFPSNIQGLPTWYEVRVSEKGHLGRREGVDLMIAVNPQGAWHRFQSSEGVTLMAATPFPSEVIELDVDDPRTVARKPA